MAEFKCPDCGKLINRRAAPGTVGYCRSCKTERTMAGELKSADPWAGLADSIASAMPKIEPPPSPVVNFHEGAFKSGDIHVQPANIERGAVQVSMAAPLAAKAPVVNIEVPTKSVRRDVQRDEKGRITSVLETEVA